LRKVLFFSEAKKKGPSSLKKRTFPIKKSAFGASPFLFFDDFNQKRNKNETHANQFHLQECSLYQLIIELLFCRQRTNNQEKKFIKKLIKSQEFFAMRF
jgi:hypothetical protein